MGLLFFKMFLVMILQVEVGLLGLWFERFGALHLGREVLGLYGVLNMLRFCCGLEKLGLYGV